MVYARIRYHFILNPSKRKEENRNDGRCCFCRLLAISLMKTFVALRLDELALQRAICEDLDTKLLCWKIRIFLDLL